MIMQSTNKNIIFKPLNQIYDNVNNFFFNSNMISYKPLILMINE